MARWRGRTRGNGWESTHRSRDDRQGAGGFCSEPFGQVHVEAYATAAVLAALGMLVGATAVTLRVSTLLLAASAGALVTTVLVFVGESLA